MNINDILLKVIKVGNHVRVFNSDTKKSIVGIVASVDTNLIISTAEKNYIGDLFSKSAVLTKKLINLQNSNLFLVSMREYAQFKDRINKAIETESSVKLKELLSKICDSVDDHSNLCKKITTQLIRTGYNMYPDQKSGVFNSITSSSMYINNNEEPSFNIIGLVSKSGHTRRMFRR